MRRAAALLVVLALAAVAGGCGGDEEKEVRKALAAWAPATQKADGVRYCDGLTPASARLIESVADPTGRASVYCSRTMAQQLRRGRRGAGGLDRKALAALEDGDVTVDGDRATLKRGKRTLAMRKVEGDWRVDLVNSPPFGFRLSATAACNEDIAGRVYRPLPAATRGGIAAEATAEARSLLRLRRTLRAGDPPAELRGAARRFDRFLVRGARTWRSGAKALRGAGSPVQAYNRARTRVLEMADDVDADALKLRFACVTREPRFDGAEGYFRAAERACTRTLEEVEDRAGSPTAIRASLGGLARRLGAIKPPYAYSDLHGAAVRGLRRLSTSLPRATSEVERFELRALASVVTFIRLGLSTCAQL